MNRSIRSKIMMAVVAIGTVGAAATAGAATGVSVAAGSPAPVYVRTQLAYPMARVQHEQRRPDYYAQGERYGYDEHERGRHHSCRAPRWDPEVRYMPGDAVWRGGTLYVATGVSAHVWNVNSPPEWTPNYWVQATCR
jgi:hypothetical protein